MVHCVQETFDFSGIGGTDNIPPTSSIPNLSKCGEDTVEISVWVKNNAKKFLSYFNQFADARDEARETGEMVAVEFGNPENPDYAVVSGHQKYHQGIGLCTLSYEVGGFRFRYIPEPILDDRPNFLLSMGSIPLMYMGGLENCWRQCQGIFNILGGIVKKNRISRVDLCADIVGWDVEPIQRAFYARKYITRARNWKENNQDSFGKGLTYTGFRVGLGGDAMIRFYDKLAELRSADNSIKWDVILQARYGGEMPEKAVRVEFQIRRNKLKTFVSGDGVITESIEDYLKIRPEIVQYLTYDWFRMTTKKPDTENKNHSKAKTSKFWMVVQKTFAEWAGQGTGTMYLHKSKVEVDGKKNVAQAVGLLLGAFCAEDRCPDNVADFASLVARRILRLSEDEFKQKRMKKIIDLISECPKEYFQKII